MSSSGTTKTNWLQIENFQPNHHLTANREQIWIDAELTNCMTVLFILTARKKPKEEPKHKTKQRLNEFMVYLILYTMIRLKNWIEESEWLSIFVEELQAIS